MRPVAFVVAAVGLFFTFSWFRSVPQATVAVITVFGKYRRAIREGLNVKFPWEKVFQRLSLQNRALQLEFQAITQDHANVNLATLSHFPFPASQREGLKSPTSSFLSPQYSHHTLLP